MRAQRARSARTACALRLALGGVGVAGATGWPAGCGGADDVLGCDRQGGREGVWSREEVRGDGPAGPPLVRLLSHPT